LWAYWRRFTGGGWSGGLFPIAFFGENQGRSYGVLAPLFWRWSGPQDATTLLAPFFYWHRDPQGTAGGVPLALTFWGSNAGASYAFQIPLFWRFADEDSVSQLVANTYYHERKVAHGVDWQVQIAPGPDPARAQRATQAMFQMKRIDIAALRRAADETPA
jgi:hypothetical protein